VTGSLVVTRGERTNIYFQAQGIEILVERFYEELVGFTPWLITLPTRGFQEVCRDGTSQGSTLSRECYRYLRLIWDLGIILDSVL